MLGQLSPSDICQDAQMTGPYMCSVGETQAVHSIGHGWEIHKKNLPG